MQTASQTHRSPIIQKRLSSLTRCHPSLFSRISPSSLSRRPFSSRARPIASDPAAAGSPLARTPRPASPTSPIALILTSVWAPATTHPAADSLPIRSNAAQRPSAWTMHASPAVARRATSLASASRTISLLATTKETRHALTEQVATSGVQTASAEMVRLVSACYLEP
jgi:hypothetical protein